MVQTAIVILILAFGAVASSAQERTDVTQGHKSAVSPPKVEILGTELRKIHSDIMGQDFDLLINLPRNYRDTTKTFPVIYLLDAQWDFPLLNAIFGEQYYDGFVPAIVTVGIAWGGSNPNYDSLRAKDLTPTTVKQVPQSGNAAKFLDFIKKELVPYIELNYRTVKNDRTLMGSSLGGLFTLYAMFHETGTFSRYVLTSPSLGWDNDIVYSYEKNYAEKNLRLPVRLFMAVGGLEGGVAAFQRFVDRLKTRNYGGFDLQTRVLEGIGHSGSKAEGFSRGLQAVFARPSLAIDPAVLQSCVGTYQLNPEITVRILKQNNQLVLVAPDSSRIPLYAETERDFYVKGIYLFLKMQRNDTGKVMGFHVEQFQGEAFLKKVE
jgi:predicted alpha/beta superfamily hydrolase